MLYSDSNLKKSEEENNSVMRLAYICTDPLGLHARSAGLFVKEVQTYARILYCLAYADSGKKTAEEKPGEAVRDRELSLTGTDGQLIIRMSADRLQIPRSRVIAMQSVIRKYKGELSFTRGREREEVYVILTV